MELRQLEYFMAVCKELHFTKAAEKLNIAQPTLSQQIRSLENQVGIPLFDRIGKKIALTEAGKILLDHTQRIFYEKEQAEAALRDLNGLGIGKLTIGSLFTCVHYLLSPSILKFNQLYPNIELSILGLRNGDIKKRLLENQLDLGITFLPAKEEDFEAIPLFTEELSLAVPMDHSFAVREEIEMKELENTSTILPPKNYYLRQLIDHSALEAGIELNPILEISPLESIIPTVAQGLGAAILPAPYLDILGNNQIRKVKVLNPTPKREIGFLYRKNKYMCTTTKTFISQVIETSKVFS